MLENIDCLVQLLSHLPIRERESCRAVCLNWSVAVDVLARTQKTLAIVAVGDRRWEKNSASRGTFDQEYSINSSHKSVIFWPHPYIRYHCFCQMLSRFPNVQSITFEGIEHWNDHLFHQLTTACPRLTRLQFFGCVGLGQSRLYVEKDYLNVTVKGWKRLIDHFGNQLTQLTLSDCELDDDQLAIVVGGFKTLLYLDLSGNRLAEARPLRDLPHGLRVLRVGPRLKVRSSTGITSTASIPIEHILKEAGKEVRELHLQGLLCRQVERLAEMQGLEKLSIRFMCDDPAVVSSCLAAIGRIHSLKSLEIIQVNCLPDHSSNLPPSSAKSLFSFPSLLLASSSWTVAECPLFTFLISCFLPLLQRK